MISYPYYYKTISKKKILEHFEDLKRQKIKLMDINEIRNLHPDLDTIDFEKCEGKYVITLYNYNQNYHKAHITNYFSERCRVKCRKINKKKNALKKFEEVKHKLYSKDIMKFRANVTYYLWSRKYLCQLYKNYIIRDLYKYFNARNILDFSAGWGDRLIAAASLDVKYTGVDPSKCMKPIYDIIINTLVDKNRQKNYNVIYKKFEDTNFKQKFDFIFSSPPFFTLEIYEENNSEQSINKYRDLESWFQSFLCVIIQKSYMYLEKNGYFGININDFGKYKFLDRMNEYCIKNKFKYIGRYFYINQYEDPNKNYAYKWHWVFMYKKV